MCSIIDGLTIHRKLQSINSQPSNLTSITYDDDLVEWCVTLTFLVRLIAYIAILTLLMIVAFIILKYINEYEETSLEDVGDSAETDPLQPAGKTMPSTYGTCDEWDVESGNCSSSSSNSSNAIITSSSEDLYDGKICMICYTEQRDCFLVPCGHCATCYGAERHVEKNFKIFQISYVGVRLKFGYLIKDLTYSRIFYGETKTCPICRRFIRKVRRLFAA